MLDTRMVRACALCSLAPPFLPRTPPPSASADTQGEADAEERHGPGPAEAYAANFSAFVAAARRDLSAFHAQVGGVLQAQQLVEQG